jgi:hypothetical protein
VPEASRALAGVRSGHPDLPRGQAEARSRHRDPHRSSRAVPSLLSRRAESSGGALPSRTQTKDGVSARSSPGGARRVRISAGRSPHQDKTDAGVRAPEAAEGATTATAMAILATGHPTGADPAVDQAAARAVVRAAEDGEARHRGRTQPQAAPEERHHPRLPLEEEAAPESEDHHSTGSADLPRG